MNESSAPFQVKKKTCASLKRVSRCGAQTVSNGTTPSFAFRMPRPTLPSVRSRAAIFCEEYVREKRAESLLANPLPSLLNTGALVGVRNTNIHVMLVGEPSRDLAFTPPMPMPVHDAASKASVRCPFIAVSEIVGAVMPRDDRLLVLKVFPPADATFVGAQLVTAVPASPASESAVQPNVAAGTSTSARTTSASVAAL